MGIEPTTQSVADFCSNQMNYEEALAMTVMHFYQDVKERMLTFYLFSLTL